MLRNLNKKLPSTFQAIFQNKTWNKEKNAHVNNQSLEKENKEKYLQTKKIKKHKKNKK